MKIVLATRNQGKIKELSKMLQEIGPEIEVVGLSDFPEIGDIEETGETFKENAFIKSRAVSSATGMIAVADDSGLEVKFLNGRPGVHSARYSGEKATDSSNNSKLLKALEGVKEEDRKARFVCVMTATTPQGREISVRGEWPGVIATSKQGENGFGYDPLFYVPEKGKTSASLDSDEKNSLSHRGKALKKLINRWPELMDKA